LVAAALLGLMVVVGVTIGRGLVARQRVEVAARELVNAIERERDLALRNGLPRTLVVTGSGGLLETAGLAGGRLELSHNLPEELRISANGLLIDGGTVVVAGSGTDLRRCLVMAIPVGVLRPGRYTGAAGGVSATECVRDERA
jgi:hypothetical protein